MTLTSTAVVLKPAAAASQLERERGQVPGEVEGGDPGEGGEESGAPAPGDDATAPRRFYGRLPLDPVRLTSGADQIAREVLQHLTSLKGADVAVTLDIRASLPEGTPEHVVRTVTENCRTLKFEQAGFEDE